MPPSDTILPSAPQATLEIQTSRQFPNFLAEQGISLALTTYQAGKLFLLGTRPDGRLSVFERTLERCMGLHATAEALHVATLYQIWKFQNVLPPGTTQNEHDAVFTPRMSWVTGDLDVHDLALGADGTPVFVNTLFSCLASVSATASFTPLWKPRFISRLAAEDRCHLNGMAMRDGKPAFATAVGQSDVADGWREHRRSGGCLIDVESGEVAVTGLSMPHSPRWHNGKLWMLNAGTGDFGWADTAAGKFEPVAFCAGYARGLSLIGDFALIGLSLPRDNKTFTGLPLDDELTRRGAEPRCAVLVIDLRTGDTVHWARFTGVVTELYDVAAIPGSRRPSAIGFRSDEIRRVISIGDSEL